MGNVIIKASHVGTNRGSGSSYPGPATDAEMEIAKRAAKVTRKRWSQEKERQRSKAKKTQLPKKSAAASSRSMRKRLRLPKEETIGSPSIAKKALSRHGRTSTENGHSDPSSHQTLEGARKLGISDPEFARRISALRAWSAQGKASQ